MNGSQVPPAATAPDFGPVEARDLLRRLNRAHSLMRMVGASARYVAGYPDDDAHPVESESHGRDPSRFRHPVELARQELFAAAMALTETTHGPDLHLFVPLRVVESLELALRLDEEERMNGQAVLQADMCNMAEIAVEMLFEALVLCARQGVDRLAAEAPAPTALTPEPVC